MTKISGGLVGGLLAVAAAALSTTEAQAFCGFYVSGADEKMFNNATQVVMLRSNTRTVLSMQNNYQGPPQKFAMVVPVPVVLQKENVKTLTNEIFAKIDQLSAPRLVEYWEQDPCYIPPPEEEKDMASAPASVSDPAKPSDGPGGVKVEAQFTVGEYEIVILSAKDAGGLDAWLRGNNYTIPDGAKDLFRPYIQKGSKFFVAKVDPSKVKFDEKTGMATLSPLRFHYDEDSFTLPIRLGLINAKDAQDLVVHVLADNKRFEVANYPNATIPTNLDLSEKAKTEFGSFYTSLFDRTLEKNPKAVITEYSWQSSSCDPCPGPVLDNADILTLGGDSLPPHAGAASFQGYVLTRLHARYTKSTLGEDLIFREAPPIQGGREMMSMTPNTTNDKDAKPTLEHGATPSRSNNFQGRYAIRHPWTGPIACKDPRRGIWAGPPAGAAATKSPDKAPPAKELAMLKRGAPLASYVRSEIPEIGFKPNDVVPLGAVGSSPSPAARSGGGGDVVPPSKSKCGCDVPGVGGVDFAAPGFGLAALAIASVRRRRRFV